MPQSWLHEFHYFSPVHWLAIVAIAIATVAAILPRRRITGNPADRLDRSFAILLAVVLMWCHLARYWATGFHGVRSLPLHLCHLTSVAAPLAIGLNWWWARVVLYFWGLILGSQALITPELHEGLVDVEFWSFWLGHGAITVAAIYDLAARGFRPGLRAWVASMAMGLLYVAAVTPVNIAYDLNFGFLGPRLPRQKTVLDLLGPWPLRMLWIVLIGGGLMLIAAIPWALALRRRGVAGSGPAQPPDLNMER